MMRLSPRQHQLWTLFTQTRRLAWSQIVVDTGPDVRAATVRACLEDLLMSHEILRMVPPHSRDGGHAFSSVAARLALSWTESPGGEALAATAEAALAGHRSLVPLPGEPLPIAVHVIPSPAGGLGLVLSVPALYADGWTMRTVVRDPARRCLGGTGSGDDVPYSTYAAWQRDLQREDDAAEAAAYWAGQAASGSWPELPFLSQGAGPRDPAPARIRFSVAGRPIERLAALATSVQGGLWHVFMACWATLLWRISRTDVSLFASFPCRTFDEFRSIAGPVARWIPLAARFGELESFASVADRIARASAMHEQWQDHFGEADPSARADGAAVGFECEEREPGFERIPGLVVRELYTPLEHLALKLSCQLDGGRAAMALDFDAARMRREDARSLAASFCGLLRGAGLDASRPCATLSMHPAGVRGADGPATTSSAQLSGGAAGSPAGSVPEWFAAQAAAKPGRVAVRQGEVTMSYGELDARAARLAERLRALGVRAETRVGIRLGRTPELLVAILGVWKAGGAYVPVDVGEPAARAAKIFRDAGVVGVIDEAGAATSENGSWRVTVAAAGEADGTTTAGSAPIAAAQLCYVIYTSGSTGTPKGVMVTHGALWGYARWAVDAYRVTEGRGVPVHTGVAVDLTVTSLLVPLLAGGCVELVEGVEALAEGGGYSLVKLTPTHLEMLTAVLDPARAGSWSGALVIGGEALRGEMLGWWRQHGGRTQVINEYGPTEATVACSAHELAACDTPEHGAIPIGRPIANADVYVLDAAMQRVPVWVAGEIYVGGPGLARGYLARPDLTAAAFVPHPFSEVAGARLYRTGDLGRYRADGTLEYLGRIDAQVKIRGYRVEPGEVEAVLRTYPAVEQAAVVARAERDGSRRLVAYLVSGAAVEAEAIRGWAAQRLPDHMVPTKIVALSRMPLTASGKVDRARLPAPEPDVDLSYTAPRTPTEAILSSIWAQVLGLDRVSVTASFFHLGGDSIQSLRVLALAKKRGMVFSLQDLLAHPTVAGLAAVLARSAPDALGAAPDAAPEVVAPFAMLSSADRDKLPDDVEDAYPLSMLQAGMLYHTDLTPEAPPYHNVNSYHLRGSFDAEAFQRAVDRAIARHANLRTFFDFSAYSVPLQLVRKTAQLRLRVEDIAHLTPDEQTHVLEAVYRQEWTRRFDIAATPLMRIAVYRRGPANFELTLAESHAISDGWSTTSLFAEILDDYTAQLRGASPPQQPVSPVRFVDFVYLERQTLESEDHRQFWRKHLAGARALTIPRWPSAPRAARLTPKRLVIEIPRNLGERLETSARLLGVPIKSLLLAVHIKVLSVLSGRRDVLTGMVTNGRPEVPGADQARGMFLNTVPFRVHVAKGTWRDLVERVFHTEVELLPYRRYPLAAMQQEHGREPLITVPFTFLHFHSVTQALRTGEIQFLDDVTKDVAWTNYDLQTIFQCDLLDGKVGQLWLEYDLAAFAEVEVARIGELYLAALREVTDRPDRAHDGEWILTADDRRLLDAAARNAAATPTDSMPAWFAAQAAAKPAQVAVRHGEVTMSYGELDARAARLAVRLRTLGVGAETRVGIRLGRTPELLVAILGVWKAGGAYVPVDVGDPAARAAKIFRDAGVVGVITGEFDEAGAAEPADGPWRVTVAAAAAASTELAEVASIDPAQLCYVIYTSGSTGAPEGVKVTHGALWGYARWAVDAYRVAEGQGGPVHAGVAVDLTVTSLLVPLLAGGCVELGEDVEALAEGGGYSLVKLTPAHLERLTAVLDPARAESWSGAPVARGYLARPDLTASAFVPRPFSALWQQEVVLPQLAPQVDYWQRALAEAPAALELPADRSRPAVQSSTGGTVPVVVDEDLTARLEALGRVHGATLFMVLESAWAVLLCRYSRQERVVVGVPVTNRTQAEIEPLIGMFVNTLAIHHDLRGRPSFAELLERTKATVLSASEHADVPFEQLEVLAPTRDPSRHPLFQTFFSLEYERIARPTLPGPETAPLLGAGKPPCAVAQFDLSMLLTRSPGAGLEGEIAYSAALFDRATIARLSRQHRALLHAIAAEPQVSVDALPLSDDAERAELAAWNAMATNLGAGPVHELVGAQAHRTPGQIAVISAGQQVTYAELIARANQLAHYLRRRGVGPDMVVAVLVERSVDLVVAMLGILQAGGAYLPLDPEHPPARLAFAVRDAGAAVLVTQHDLAHRIDPEGVHVVCVDSDGPDIARERKDSPESGANADHLAYVMYTSGSTGRPKGVAISRRSLAQFVGAMQQGPRLTGEDTILAVTTASFDISAVELLLPLVCGARIVLASRRQAADGEALQRLLADTAITVMQATPATWRMLVTGGWAGRRELRIWCGGEALPVELAAALLQRGGELWNLYGPTEATVWAAAWRVTEAELERAAVVTIGRPLRGVSLYVLDADLRPVPVGVPGELYIGGLQLARGYLGRPELTAERFVPDPLATAPGARLYRTGDLARYRPAGDGAIEFLGRLDLQVKLRGFRIELGEIEAALRELPGIRDAVVIARDERLSAYVVSAEDAEPSREALREALAARLPAYMLPHGFIALPAFPLTSSGKLDRKALPAPDAEIGIGSEHAHVAPRTDVERVLAQIWSELLRADQVGVYDDFFSLGGHSLLALQVVARARRAGLPLEVRQLFEHPTIAGLAAALAAAAAPGDTAPAPAAAAPSGHDDLPLTPNQWWFTETFDVEHHTWAMTASWQAPAGLTLDLARLRAAAEHVIAHHDALRLRLYRKIQGWGQRLVPTPEVPVVEHHLGGATPDDRRRAILAVAGELQRSLSIVHGPVLALAVCRVAGEPDQLLISIHHSNYDAYSLGPLTEDFMAAYAQVLAGQAPELPPVPTPYRQYLLAVARHIQSPAIAQDRAFWLDSTRLRPVPALPVDLPGGRHTDRNSRRHAVVLTAKLIDDSRAWLAAHPEVSLNDLLLFGLVRSYARWSGAAALRLDLEHNGRTGMLLDIDLVRTIGPTTLKVPVLFELGPEEPGEQALGQLQRTLRETMSHTLGFGLLRYGPDPEARAALLAIGAPQVFFNNRGLTLGRAPAAQAGFETLVIPRADGGENVVSYDLMVECDNMPDGPTITWVYSSALHRPETIATLADGALEQVRRLVRSE